MTPGVEHFLLVLLGGIVVSVALTYTYVLVKGWIEAARRIDEQSDQKPDESG